MYQYVAEHPLTVKNPEITFASLMITTPFTDEFLRDLDREIHAHPFLTDPLMRRMSKPGGITRDQARRFAVLYYPHIFRTRLYQANALGISPDENVQYVLAEIIHDEYGNGDAS